MPTGIYVHKPLSEESKRKVSESKQFEKNYNWKGDKVGYSALHKWVYKVLGKAKKCGNCETAEGRIEWANISGEYKRSVSDWEQLCRKCHMIKDGRVANAARNARMRIYA